MAEDPRSTAAATDGDSEPGGLALALPLIALAGWVDALGVVQWHGLYVSFMSGNTTTLGASPWIGDWRAAGEAGRAVLAFVAGAVLGELIGPAARDWRAPAVVGATAAALWAGLAAAMLPVPQPGLAAIAAGLAMGLQTAAIHKVDGTAIAITYVTGTLVSLARAIADALRGKARWRRTLPFLGCWLSLLGGAAAGGVSARTGTAGSLVVSAVAATALAILAGAGVAARRRRARQLQARTAAE